MDEEDSVWRQMERCMKQEGFREGVGEGREKAFQQGFDDGWADGFEIGKMLGNTHGKTAVDSEKKEDASGLIDNCVICRESPIKGKAAIPESIYTKTLDEIKSEQKSLAEKLERDLKSFNST